MTPEETGVGIFANWTAPLACCLVKQKYGITIVNDEADAILIGQYGADKYGKKVELIEW